MSGTFRVNTKIKRNWNERKGPGGSEFIVSKHSWKKKQIKF